MTTEPRAVLLDTCALIWLANGDVLSDGALKAIAAAASADGVFVSAISAWEVGLLSRLRSGQAFSFVPDPKTWFARVMARSAFRPAQFTAEIAIDSSHLPGEVHGDPADRLLIATARHLAIPIVTRDRKIAAYAAQGHLQLVPC